MSNVYSSHIFMFPFRFDYVEKGFENEFDFYKDKTIDERVDLKKLKKAIKKDWDYEPLKLKKDINNGKDYIYNEFAYFYDYARDAIYNQSEDNPISYYFEKKFKNVKYQIDILEKKPYILDITGLSLRCFHTGVGILSIEFENRHYDKFDDILKINDFGRRIYPQFISMPPKLLFKDAKNQKLLHYFVKPYKAIDWCIKYSTNVTKKSFLADSIKIIGNYQKDKIDYKIDTKESFNFKPSDDIVIGDHIMKLLGDSFTQYKKDNSQKYYIQPILDDRMFVLSWHGNNLISNELKICHNYKNNDKWYKYLFIDGNGINVKNTEMKEQLLKKATYDRWSDNGTLWGVSRYSMVVLTDSSGFWLSRHLHSMYSQMIIILLATRSSILRFSDEVATLASDDTLEIDRLTRLYQRYLIFYNRLNFKELTHQEQGIELYNMAREQMKIDEHIEKLDNKFTKLFEFANLQEEKKSTQSMNDISKIGAIFLPPSLLVALFSMGIYDYDKSLTSLFVGLSATFASAVLGYVAIRNIIKKRKK